MLDATKNYCENGFVFVAVVVGAVVVSVDVVSVVIVVVVVVVIAAEVIVVAEIADDEGLAVELVVTKLFSQ